MNDVRFMELFSAPAAKWRWSDGANGRIMGETLMAGVTVNEVARRHGLKARLIRDGSCHVVPLRAVR